MIYICLKSRSFLIQILDESIKRKVKDIMAGIQAKTGTRNVPLRRTCIRKML